MLLGRARPLLATCLVVLIGACGGDEDDVDAPVIPDLGTPWRIVGTALAGRAATLSTVGVLSAEDAASVTPRPLGGGDLDFFFAGFDADDLPRGIDPKSLRFVSERSDRAHRLFALRAPHVLARTIQPGGSFALVPVEEAGLPAVVRNERRERLDTMIEELAVRDVCVDPPTPIEVVIPTTSGEKLNDLRAMSNGVVYGGLTATGTVVLATLDPATRAIAQFGVRLAVPASRFDRVNVLALGAREARDRSGRIIPRDLTLRFDGASGATGRFVTWDDTLGAYVDQTPTGGVPASLFGAVSLELEGTPSLCVHGSELGPNQVASIYCRVATSTVWDRPQLMPQAFSITSMISDAERGPLAFDRTGTTYVRRNRRWESITSPAVNDGCSPPCVLFNRLAPTPAEASALRAEGVLGVLAGAQGQVLLVQGDGASRVALESVEGLEHALFADERAGGAHAIEIRAAAWSPDGALWLAPTENVLLRVPPDRTSVERLCVPATTGGNAITALLPLDDGTLILGLNPTILAFARWR